MIRRIVQLGEPVLKATSRALGLEDLAREATRSLAQDLLETLEHSGGVGLAAPQVGESVRMIVAGSFPSRRGPDRPDVPVAAMVNPTIVRASDETEAGWEGCLSFPDYRVRVVRPLAVQVEYWDLDGRETRVDATGFFARVLQHEIDHLDGILTLDRAQAEGDVVRMDPDVPR